MILVHWATSDHCGGILYGPHTRREAFAIQKQMTGADHPCDRQDVYLVTNWVPSWRMQGYRLIRFKCKGESKNE